MSAPIAGPSNLNAAEVASPSAGPSGVSAEFVYFKEVAISWTQDPTCAPETLGYRIYRLKGAHSDGLKVVNEGVLAGTTTETAFLDRLIYEDFWGLYSYAMVAYNNNGDSEPTVGVLVDL